MAECHPVGFQWVMEAKARGATVIHVDPRFTRTSAVADLYVPLRAGSDIAFVGGLINYVLQNEKYFSDYVLAYTNAATILTEDYADTEDLDGVFSGLNAEHRYYDFDTWRYQGAEVRRPAATRDDPDPQDHRRTQRGGAAGRPRRGARLRRRRRPPGPGHRPHAAASAVRVPGAEAALRAVHPGDGRAGLRGAAGPVRRGLPGSSPTTPAGSARPRSCTASAGPSTPSACSTSAPPRSCRRCSGNMGRPGGGILALRGHASIQGSTDIPTLFDLLPGYLPMPHAHGNEDLDTYVEAESVPTGSGPTPGTTWSAC